MIRTVVLGVIGTLLVLVVVGLIAGNRRSPSDQQPAVEPAAAVATSILSSCATTGQGGVRCWGQNDYGQLGNGSWDTSSSPVDVLGLSSKVADISAGANNVCALLTDGMVACWGNNSDGQLGDGSTTDRNVPSLVDLGDGAVAISAGTVHACAVTTDGGVKCWGGNNDDRLGDGGRLGDGSRESSLVPVDVVGLGSGVSAIAAGTFHTCAVTTEGAVKCWGGNDDGQLGDGSRESSLVPVDVVGLGSGVSAIAAGPFQT